ncbi:MAG: hypothetical protein K0Q68_505 [Moraxellaceae bacterium]|jgi:diguanylate cyclase (GGDEF)-like protein|nr:hypothetical protein [Moraxellaceae bacterium]
MAIKRILLGLGLLRWSRVERALAPVLMVALVYSYYLAGMGIALGLEGRDRFINVGLVESQLSVFASVIAGALGLMVLGLLLRRHRADSLLFQHVAAHYFSFSLVWVGYLTGPLGYTAGVVLMGAALSGYIALERQVILPAFVTAFLLILGLNLAAAFEFIAYAPALRAPTDQASALFWTNATFFLAAPHIAFSVGAMTLMLGFWQKRENYVLRLGLTDALTHVHNRRSILVQLEAEMARTQRLGQPLAVALLDLDHFKRINDTWGHPAGDRVLRAAAAALKASLRPGDAIGRFGGEEFLLVLPGRTLEEAAQQAEQCRAQLATLALVADSGEPMPVSGSFGLVWNPAGAVVSAEARVHAADSLLYAAKQAGRNCVCQGVPEAGAGDAAKAREQEWKGNAARILRGQETPPPVSRRLLRLLGDFVKGWPAWNQADKQIFFLALSIAMFASFAGWGGWVLYLEDREQLVKVPMGESLMLYLAGVIAGFVLLIGIGLYIRKRWPNSWLYQLAGQQFFALTLVFAGYFLGILSFPVGIMLVGLPLIGFIYFSRSLVLLSFATSLVVTVALAYASAFGWLPYAPLLAEGVDRYQPHSFFWGYTAYHFTFPTLLVILVLADQTLGRWRQRGQQVLAMSRTDALTQVHNRRSILGVLDREVARTRHRGPALAVVILDLDHFKKINDTWGHPTGDRVLQEAARVLEAAIRDGDAVGRYGGEEFLLLLPDTPLAGAAALVERCRAQLAATRVQADNGDTFTISASFGVASNEQALGLDAEALVKAADEALYRAKEGGRNRVETVAAGALARA